MRIWDLHPSRLCRQHLLGEHRELHAIWTVLTEDRDGYSRHPETRRWRGKRAALYLRHRDQVVEMISRGYNHNSPLEFELASGSAFQFRLIDSRSRQRRMLVEKCRECERRLSK